MTKRFSLLIAVTTLLSSLLVVAQVRDPRPEQVQNFQPVTEGMLRNPPPGDWVNWRRTDNSWGYSPLNEINTKNVQQLPRLPTSAQGFPITYAVKGKQYVAVPAGVGGASWSTMGRVGLAS